MYDEFLDNLISICESNIILENFSKSQTTDDLLKNCISIIKNSQIDVEIKKNIKYNNKSSDDDDTIIFTIDFLNILSIKKLFDSDASNQEINKFMTEKTKTLFNAIDKCKIECTKYNKSSSSNIHINIDGDKWDDLLVTLVNE